MGNFVVFCMLLPLIMRVGERPRDDLVGPVLFLSIEHSFSVNRELKRRVTHRTPLSSSEGVSYIISQTDRSTQSSESSKQRRERIHDIYSFCPRFLMLEWRYLNG